ncbi:MAG: hypothetical protein PVG14_18705 [Anaerolineales bacterium]|jgi:hypothetical protein
MSEAEIVGLIDEYNAMEAQQDSKLQRIFYLIKNERKGYRRVDFESDILWSNCWSQDWAAINDYRVYIKKLRRKITNYTLGEEK